MSDEEIVRGVLEQAAKETATKMLPVDVFLDASLALDRLESQNQALQERADRQQATIVELLTFIRSVGTPGWYATRDQLLSPTQETDPE